MIVLKFFGLWFLNNVSFMRIVLLTLISLSISSFSWAQGCCSGGSGSPIAGGAATGVLQKSQMEVSGNFQINESNKFLAGSKDTLVDKFENLSSSYLFTRVDYGVSDKLTISAAAGYFLDKTFEESEGKEVSSSGFGDLIVLPRYDIFNKKKGLTRTELTLGLGVKIPLGSHIDSNLVISSPIIGDIYTTSPPTVQPTNGSSDIMFYSFFLKSYQNGKTRLFSNALYIKKGFNSLGEKFGDYGSVSVFYKIGFLKKCGFTTQIKGEAIGKMQSAEHIDLLAYYNIYQESTGSKKVFFIPQISYTHESITLYTTSEIPLYQYLNGSQVASKYQFTAGLNYRFFTKKPKVVSIDLVH
jgi:hypothetical protein